MALGWARDAECAGTQIPRELHNPLPMSFSAIGVWGITLAIESELWNQRQKSGKKRMEITGAKLKRDVTQDAYKKLMSNQSC